MSDLKPCPFCDGVAVVDVSTDAIFNLRCTSCAAEGPWAKSKAAAVGSWNRRTAEARAEKAEAALAEARESADSYRAEALRLVDEGDTEKKRADYFEGEVDAVEAILVAAGITDADETKFTNKVHALVEQRDAEKARAEKAELLSSLEAVLAVWLRDAADGDGILETDAPALAAARAAIAKAKGGAA
jgi:hypothetical protein